MIGYFKTVGAPASNLDYEGVQTIVHAEHVKNLCSQVAAGDKEAKRRLPAFTWQATFEEGAPRSNKNARPTGMFIIDIDHVEGSVRDYYESLRKRDVELFQERLVAAHVTPSQHGLRLVFICDGEDTTLAEQQRRVARRLGIAYDEVTKDFARLSFAVPMDYFLAFDAMKFATDYSHLIKNTEYEETIGKNASGSAVAPAGADNTKPEADTHTASLFGGPEGGDKAQGGNDSKNATMEFKGIKYADIVAQLVAQTGGVPVEGERNVRLYNLCRKLRYICDFNTDKLFAIAPRFGLSETEVRGVCESANKGSRTGKIPYDLWKIVEDLSAPADEADDSLRGGEADIDSTFPPLPPIFKQYAKSAPADFRPAVVCALLPVLGTLCSRLRAEYLDGEKHAPNFQTVIEGPQASGKSFTRRIVDECMRPVILHDAQERLKEQAYIEACRQNKNAKKQPDEPQTLVRVIPASISIAKLLKRLTSSSGLHLFSYLEELDTLTKSNRAGAWSQKSDIYRNAYDNAFYGQDYMSENSYSALVQVYYNLLLCGTPNAVSRFYNDPEDGLVSRVLFAQLPSQFGAEMPRFKKMTTFEQKMITDRCNALNNTLCVNSDDTPCAEHELDLEWLNRRMDKWLERQRIQAVKENNYARDIFRRRAAVNGFRAGMIAFYLYDEKATKKVRDDVEEFATWVADYCLYNLLMKFGESVNEQATTVEQKQFVRNKPIYEELGDSFTKDILYALLAKRRIKTPIKCILHSWRKADLIEETENGYLKINCVDSLN